ncbi:hypothetical protein AB0L71_28530 [Streptomyces sp. NPDC052052]|uniref:hypothetical protein n=1 Tax=Streptomyces sp. NPDC052052 TaxID=3154756 RepID=UPI00343729DF
MGKPVTIHPKCNSSRPCVTPPTWKVRQKGDSLERNWLFTCGRHLHQVAIADALDAGVELDLVRIRSDE